MAKKKGRRRGGRGISPSSVLDLDLLAVLVPVPALVVLVVVTIVIPAIFAIPAIVQQGAGPAAGGDAGGVQGGLGLVHVGPRVGRRRVEQGVQGVVLGGGSARGAGGEAGEEGAGGGDGAGVWREGAGEGDGAAAVGAGGEGERVER